MKAKEVSKVLRDIFGHKLEDKELEFKYSQKIAKTLANTIENKVADNEYEIQDKVSKILASFIGQKVDN